ncbi:hypothetical protein [Bradyrhizobium sp. BR 1433]|uniref:hypothetical protein n=1 Tax=Bradyrhizobium sp. BR 1433 TaxID=3447967 RepID=UPI003EE6650E
MDCVVADAPRNDGVLHSLGTDNPLGNAEVTFRSFRIAQASHRLQHQGMEMLMLVLQ